MPSSSWADAGDLLLRADGGRARDRERRRFSQPLYALPPLELRATARHTSSTRATDAAALDGAASSCLGGSHSDASCSGGRLGSGRFWRRQAGARFCRAPTGTAARAPGAVLAVERRARHAVHGAPSARARLPLSCARCWRASPRYTLFSAARGPGPAHQAGCGEPSTDRTIAVRPGACRTAPRRAPHHHAPRRAHRSRAAGCAGRGLRRGIRGAHVTAVHGAATRRRTARAGLMKQRRRGLFYLVRSSILPNK